MTRLFKISCSALVSSILYACSARYLPDAPVSNLVSRPIASSNQTLVTWDSHSLYIRDERVFLFSGEFHPFRLPSPGLWFDVFQKIKALGYVAVSFYTDWALLEAQPGQYRADGIFALEPFFEAASEAGIYLIARPGPYINAETSGDVFNATRPYLSGVLRNISAAQITRGGPVILVQYENEYSIPATFLAKLNEQVGGSDDPFAFTPEKLAELRAGLDSRYMEAVKQRFLESGIDVPLIINDAIPAGNWVPGSGPGAADIYGIDGYPFTWGNTYPSHPNQWPTSFASSSLVNHSAHELQSPNTPFSIVEFQGGSWPGNGSMASFNQTLTIPAKFIQSGQKYVLTILIDHMGLDEDFAICSKAMKAPRGILDYNLSGYYKSAITWKMTGNLGGESYKDLTRRPLNEGAMWVERQGYHLPGAPMKGWKSRSPLEDGVEGAGVGFFATRFRLDVPDGYDVPMAFVFKNDTGTAEGMPMRCQLFVNGYQFGEYVNNIGPQTRFPVPEGVLNHNGENYVALTLWSVSNKGAKLPGLELVPVAKIMSGYRKPALSPMEGWSTRDGAY